MKPLLLTWVLACGADAATTHQALTMGTAREVALPSQNPYVIDGLITAQAVGGAWALSRLHRHHPKTAIVLGWSLTALRIGAVAWNLHQR